MPKPDGPLVLDTHVWIWVTNGQSQLLGRGAVAAIEAASRQGNIWIPSICAWEVAMLETRGRLSLTRAVDDWVRLALRAPGVRLLDLTPEIAVASTRLPGCIHGDHADRIIIASARATGSRLATRDRAILDYAAAGHLKVLDVTS